MPFVDPDTPKNASALDDGLKNFIGRTNELNFFIQHILKPEKPICNLLSISGDGGVGKSTLLSYFINIARLSNFKDYCLTALVNERQTSPFSMMEKFAEQLHITGDFEKALISYKEALRKSHNEHETMREAFWRKATLEVAGEAVKTVPVVGAVLEKGTGPAIGYLFDELHERQLLKDAERLEDPIGDLTWTFVKELNHLANAQVTLNTTATKRRRRVILFFDTFEQLATEGTPWLLDYFLETDISANVVLVVAGRDPLDRSTPQDPKRWLRYYDANAIYPISLNSFTQDETKAYLSKKGITDPKQIDTILHLSRGLPLYLGLLTSNRVGEVDPTKGVVDNFLRWIPDQEQVKRRLALDAALFSRPFNQDDLEALAYISEQDRPALYRWLTEQPFVRSTQDGRCQYHEIVRDLFSRYLYQRSTKACYASRRAIADYFWDLLDQAHAEKGQEVYNTREWLELILALVYQLFHLPDEADHINAIEWVLNVYEYTTQPEEIIKVLHDLSQEQITVQMSAGSQKIVKALLEYFAFHWESREFIDAASNLLQKIAQEPSFPRELLARIYRNRGKAHRQLKAYLLAIEDFDRAIALSPDYGWAYASRGTTYRLLNNYQRAIEDFDRALTLNPEYVWVYANRGIAYRLLNNYQRAIEDFDHALTLDTNYTSAYSLRGETNLQIKRYKEAIEDFDHALKLDPQSTWTKDLRITAHYLLKETQKSKESTEASHYLPNTVATMYTPSPPYPPVSPPPPPPTPWWEILRRRGKRNTKGSKS